MVVVDSKSLFFFLLAEEENMDYDLLAGFGSLIIFKHGVSYLHFTRLKIAKWTENLKLKIFLKSYRCQSRTFVDGVIAFFTFVLALRNVSTSIPWPLFVLRRVKSDHLLLGMLVMVELGVMGQFAVSGWGGSIFTRTGDSISRIFHVFGCLGIFPRPVAHETRPHNDKDRQSWGDSHNC